MEDSSEDFELFLHFLMFDYDLKYLYIIRCLLLK